MSSAGCGWTAVSTSMPSKPYLRTCPATSTADIVTLFSYQSQEKSIGSLKTLPIIVICFTGHLERNRRCFYLFLSAECITFSTVLLRSRRLLRCAPAVRPLYVYCYNKWIYRFLRETSKKEEIVSSRRTRVCLKLRNTFTSCVLCQRAASRRCTGGRAAASSCCCNLVITPPPAAFCNSSVLPNMASSFLLFNMAVNIS